jgi:hypothetical protein
MWAVKIFKLMGNTTLWVRDPDIANPLKSNDRFTKQTSWWFVYNFIFRYQYEICYHYFGPFHRNFFAIQGIFDLFLYFHLNCICLVLFWF